MSMNYRKFLSWISWVLLLGIMSLTAQAAQAATYYVAGNGNDSASGTQGSPWRTIGKCASVAVAGDTCNIRGGFTYSESVSPANSGTSSARIIFQVEPGTGTATLKSPFGGQTRGAVFDVRDKAYITIQNLTFGPSAFGWAVWVHSSQAYPGPFNSHDVTIQNNTFNSWGQVDTSTSDQAFQVQSTVYTTQAGPNIIVQNNTFSVVYGIAIHFDSDSGNSAIGNTITTVHERCMSGNGCQNAIGVFHGTDTNLLVKGNTISFLGDGSFGAGSGIWCDVSGTKSIYDGNVIHHHGGHGVVAEFQCDGITVQRNVIYNGFGGIRTTEYDGNTSNHTNNFTVYNNTVYNNSAYGIILLQGANATVKNNISMNNGNSQIMTANHLSGTIVFSNNLYFKTGGGNLATWNLDCSQPANNNCEYMASTLSFSQWVSASGETNAKNVQPSFTNASAGDFTLQTGSLCIDAGVNVGLPYNGSMPDLGAKESGQATNSVPAPQNLRIINTP